MTPSEIFGAVCLVGFIGCCVTIVVGEIYHRRRKRRWKKRVQLFHEEQARAVASPPASHDEVN